MIAMNNTQVLKIGRIVCFFKQKTAYYMRISGWSSDVCSSDLIGGSFLGLSMDALDHGGEYQDHIGQNHSDDTDDYGASRVEHRDRAVDQPSPHQARVDETRAAQKGDPAR